MTQPTLNPKSEELARLEATLAAAQNTIERVNALNKLAAHYRNSNLDRILELANEAVTLARREGYTAGLVTALRYQVHVYNVLSDYTNALKIAYEALRLCEEIQDQTDKTVILRVVGFIFVELGDYAKGLEYQLKVLTIAEELDDIPAQTRGLINVGIIHSMAGNPAQAIEYYQRSIELDPSADAKTRGRAYNSCCVDYVSLGEYERAKTYGEKAAELFLEIGDTFGVGVATSSLGEVALAREDFSSAIHYFEEALRLFKTAHGELNAIEAFDTLLNLGQAYFSFGNSEKALEYVQTILANADEQNMQRFSMKCHHLLSRIYEQQQNLPLALSHLKQYIEIREKTLNEASQQQINNLQIIHETQEAQAASERQKKLREQDRQNFERITKIKDDFLHSTTHDIKNPLSGILMSTYLLTQNVPPEYEKAHEYIKRMNDSALKIRRLVEDVLDLAKLETVPTIHAESVALTPWFDEIVNGFKTLVEAKEITLTSDVQPLELVGRFSKQRLGQALENLVSNAIKYTQNGGEVHLRATQKENQLQIQVIDNGMGIPKHDLPHIFDRFYRVDKRSTSVEGTGLGLSIVKLCVDQHGGTIEVKSKTGKGSTFTILLPL